MTVYDIREYLLKEIPNTVRAANGKQVVTRCPICGDSRKHIKEGHLYISTMEDKPFMYNCFLCDSNGVMNPNIMQNLGINNDIASAIMLHNNKIMNRNGVSIRSSSNIYVNNTLIAHTDLSLDKLRYINNRLGTQYTFSDMIDLKIVLNINDLFYQNGIQQYTRNEFIVNQLQDNFLGFLSIDNNYLILRKYNDVEVHTNIDSRYVVYNIHNKEGIAHYVIPTTFNRYLPVKLYVAEGVFDILSIHRDTVDKTNCIFLAVNGKSYSNAIQYIMVNYSISNLELHLYPDQDVKNTFFTNLINQLKLLGLKDVYIHRNMMPGEKDFGVSKDRIRESIVKII